MTPGFARQIFFSVEDEKQAMNTVAERRGCLFDYCDGCQSPFRPVSSSVLFG